MLVWLGWRLMEQDRILEAHQAQQRVERAADLVTAALERGISATEQRLAVGPSDWPDGAVAVTFLPDFIEAAPTGRLAYFPKVRPLREAPAAIFEQGEELEYRKHDSSAAIENFRELAKSSDKPVQAGALKRLGRTGERRTHRRSTRSICAACRFRRRRQRRRSGWHPGPLGAVRPLGENPTS
jgi:hypothetical protein